MWKTEMLWLKNELEIDHEEDNLDLWVLRRARNNQMS